MGISTLTLINYHCVINYILIYSKDREEHEDHLRIALQTLREHQLHAKFKKFDVWLTNVKFLRHNISKRGILMNPYIIEAILS